MRTLLVDHHDSYTFNLCQLLAEVTGTEPVVLAHDDPALAAVRWAEFDAVVLSPGPGRPQHARDVGHVPALLRATPLPVLGVCLGHQAIAHAAGAVVGPAPRPRHGHRTTVTHAGDDLFAGIPQGFRAVRYHSLRVREPLPADLVGTAWAEDGVLMALRHRTLPRWGVQFHPESVASEHGGLLLANFRDLVGPARRRTRPAPAPPVSPARASAPLRLVSTVVPRAVDAEAVFGEFLADRPTCFWLDSSRVEPGLSRFSFLGDAEGPLGEVLRYRVGDGAVTVTDAAGTRTEPGTIFDALDRRLRERWIEDPGLPFDLACGYVGYLGYELKADCGADRRHRSPTPDALWLFADRLVALDHATGLTHVLAVHDDAPGARAAAEGWVERTAARLVDLPPAPPGPSPVAAAPHPLVDRRRYLADVEECRRQLVLGESYEICLTTRLRQPWHDDDAAFYRRLRALNPAPYAALLRFPDVAVFCSSPERFLRIEPDGTVETKPIKGTAPRAADPELDARLARELAAGPKTRAENLMIVDLMRNDLGQVCEVGSVTVERYLAVESYATVHQLVSTVRGRLRPGVGAVDCVRHCFPGGSMTGAPKRRTMEIIDRLEPDARGVYSGALGYFGLAGGADLAMVIRTAVRHGGELTVGAGGAIVLDSDPAEEFAELLLKAEATLRALACHQLTN